MTDKELKKLKRIELLELLTALSEENETLKSECQKLRNCLEDRKILIDKAGSIAEAALQLSGIFEAAEKAASLYLENVKAQSMIKENEQKNEKGSESI